MSIVAISETIGSLGDDIGRMLARRLDYEFADREIISRAAERFGENVMDLAHVTEERPTLWERFTDSQRRYQAAVEAIVFEMAARDGVVLCGRGAAVLLGKVRHALKVRITAPEAVRARRLEQQQGLTYEAALDLVRHTDHERAARIKFLYHADWDALLHYDAALNTERLSVEMGARLLEEMLKEPRFATAPESTHMLTDQSITALAKAQLLEHPVTQTLRLFPSCRDGYVSVSGMVDREEQRRTAEEILKAIPGITGVLNEIVVVRPTRGSVTRL
jgi:cytidylate kinase